MPDTYALETSTLQVRGAEEHLRSSGLEIIGEMPWGTHFCQFYASASDLLDILLPYFAAGLAANEMCLWVTPRSLTPAAAEAALRQVVPSLDRHRTSGQIEIVTCDQWYTPDGVFDKNRVMRSWTEKLSWALDHGFEGLRLAGDTHWLKKDNWREFVRYEAEVDSVISSNLILASCTYPIGKYAMPEALDVFANHEFALVKDKGRWEILQNISRQKAEQALKMSQLRFRALFENMSEGLAVHEIIKDDCGEPCDYRFLDVNPAFERLTSLERAGLRGRRVSEALPGLEEDWIKTYGRVAQTGRPERFERYAAPLGRWYDVFAYRTAPGRFAAIFSDITERKEAETALKRSARRNELLSRTATRLLESDNPQAVVEGLCREVIAFLDCQVFFNYLVDRGTGRLRLNACAGISEEDARAIEWLDYGVAVCGCVARDRRRIIATNIMTTGDERTSLVKSYGVQAYCCHPLIVQGKLIGTLSFGARSRPDFSADDVELMQTVTGLVAMAMHRIQIEETLRATQAELEAEANALTRLDEVSSGLWRALDLKEGVDGILAAIVELLGADMGEVQLLDPGLNTLSVVARTGFGHPVPAFFCGTGTEEDGSSICGRILRTRKRLVVEDMENDEEFAPLRAIARAAGIRALQSTPMRNRHGVLLGVLSVCFREPRRFAPQELRRLDLYVRKAVDFVERIKTDNALRESQGRLRAVMDALPVGVAMIDARGGNIASNAAFEAIWGHPRPEVRNVADYAPFKAWWVDTGEPVAPDEWASARAIRRGETVAGQIMRIEAFDGSMRYVSNSAAPIRDARGLADGAAVAIVDITDRKRREEQIQLLLSEVNHRAKNMLAVVLAIAWRTAASDRHDFVERFTQRIEALAASQDLLVQSEWRGVEIEALARSQMAHFEDLVGTRIVLQGESLWLSAPASQSIGMAMHELLTNAAKYGALSGVNGQVVISWALKTSAASAGSGADDRDGDFVLIWRERGGPPVAAPSRRGFGHTVVVAMPRLELDADVELDYAPEGINWRLVCPAVKVLGRMPRMKSC